MSSKTPHILIVGAGLGGLALAQVLRRQSISFQIFERDESSEARQQGWAIGLHGILKDLQQQVPEGLPALAEAVNHLQPLKLPPQFMWNVNGTRLGVTAGPEAYVLRASRMRLRKWLATEITITYGKQAVDIEQTEESVTVQFQDGTSAHGDILVGADGINSHIREILLSRPNDTVLRTNAFAVIVGETSVTGAAFERQLSLGHSAYLAVCNDRRLSIFVGLNGVSENGKTGYYYWFFMIPDEHIENPDHWTKHASREERLQRALEGATKFNDKFTEIMRATPVEGIRTDSFSFRDALIEQEELPVSRVTLLGDAAHPMAPFRGEGAVHAIRDALNLANSIGTIGTGDRSHIRYALASYQKEMVARGVDAVRRSRGEIRADRKAEDVFMIWGHPAKPTPEEIVKLEDWL